MLGKTKKPFLILLLLASSSLSGCYLLKQGSYLFRERSSAEPIESYIRSHELSADETQFFERIADILRFSGETLGLKKSRNYTTYIKTDRDYVAAVVSAAGELDLDPYMWKFPLVGSVPYKGFFMVEDARSEAEVLQSKGYDTWIRGVDAFSTLGMTRDPLYSFMTDYSIHDLAEILIHEQVHATIWLRGASQFNEEVASFIGEKGAELYIAARYGNDSHEMMLKLNTDADRQQWLADITGLREELTMLYTGEADDDSKRLGKRQVIQSFKDRFAQGYADSYITDTYRSVPELDINNAFIALYGVYYGHSETLQKLYESSGSDLARFLKLILQIPKNSKDPYDKLTEIIDQEAVR